jgi:hypothetical protein
MPPLIRARLQIRQKTHTMNTSMRGFISTYKPHHGRGSEVLYVKPNTKRNTRELTDLDRVALKRYNDHTMRTL